MKIANVRVSENRIWRTERQLVDAIKLKARRELGHM